MAESTVAYPVIMITSVSGYSSLVRFSICIPPTFSIFRSVRTRSNMFSSSRYRARGPLCEAVTSYPSFFKTCLRLFKAISSSSTTKTLAGSSFVTMFLLLSR